jgi:hypothetical protein
MVVMVVALAGCRSHVIKVNLTNSGPDTVSAIIVDYPSATFGKNRLAPRETFSYAIKPLEAGPLKVRFTDASGKEHAYTGPMLAGNDEGEITLTFARNEVAVHAQIYSK